MDQWEKKTVIYELKEGKELTNQLKNHLNPSSLSSSSPDTPKFLIEKILSSYEKALSMLNWTNTLINEEADFPTTTQTNMLFPVGSSPKSVGSIDDQDFKGHVTKKRKVMDKWSETKRVKLQNRQDQGSHGDGYNWRKYGQKDILGSIHPRGYFRCTHRNVRGCLATKQVQRSDEDFNFVEIKYRRRHTCNQAAPLVPKVATLEQKQVQNQNQDHENAQPNEMLINFSTNLKVETEGFEKENPIFTSFTFASTTIESQNVDSTIFSDFPTMGDAQSFMAQYSPTLISPTTTSESNYFSLSHDSPLSNFDTRYNQYTSTESDFTEIISTTTSVTNSPMPIENLDVFSSMEFGGTDFLFDSDFLFN